MKDFKYVIIGNSAAGLSCVSAIRSIDKVGEILVVTEEDFFNYSKPLITYLLAGTTKIEDIYFKDKEFYTKNNIILKTGFKVEKIDFKNKKIISDKKEEINYKKLLISSGGSPIIPAIDIVHENDIRAENKLEDLNNLNKLDYKNYKNIEGIFTFTSIQDSLDIKKYLLNIKKADVAILGGGLIGLKAAEALLELGISVTIIELSDRILSTSFDKDASSIIENEIKDKGSSIYTNNTIKKIFTDNNIISRIELQNGEILNCNLLIAAIGVKPDLRTILNSKTNDDPIETKTGIIVDNKMKTSLKDVYAAGDVVESFDLITGKNANIAIWPLAVRQGYTAGINMAGEEYFYNGGYFMNSVEILSIPSISIGITNIEDSENNDYEIIRDLKKEIKTYKKIVIQDDKIIGLILLGNIDRAGIYGGLIKNKIDISQIKANLIKEDFGIIELPANYKKHLVIGDGIEV